MYIYKQIYICIYPYVCVCIYMQSSRYTSGQSFVCAQEVKDTGGEAGLRRKTREAGNRKFVLICVHIYVYVCVPICIYIHQVKSALQLLSNRHM